MKKKKMIMIILVIKSKKKELSEFNIYKKIEYPNYLMDNFGKI